MGVGGPWPPIAERYANGRSQAAIVLLQFALLSGCAVAAGAPWPASAVNPAIRDLRVELLAPLDGQWVAGNVLEVQAVVSTRWPMEAVPGGGGSCGATRRDASDNASERVCLAPSDSQCQELEGFSDAETWGSLVRETGLYLTLVRSRGATPLRLPVDAPETVRVEAAFDSNVTCTIAAVLRWSTIGFTGVSQHIVLSMKAKHGLLPLREVASTFDMIPFHSTASGFSDDGITYRSFNWWHAFDSTSKTDESRQSRRDWGLGAPRLSLSRIGGDGLGPLHGDKSVKVVVMIIAGEGHQTAVHAMIDDFLGVPGGMFDVMLCIYDQSDWSFLPDVVVQVRGASQMKFWFVKRFLAPAVVQGYDFIFIVDQDTTFFDPRTGERLFSPVDFVALLRAYGVQLAQPSLSGAWMEDRLQQRQILNRRLDVQGSWTNFVEAGPFVAVRRDTWGCVWDLIFSDTASGYGVDLVWSSCAATRTAVVHSWAVRHLDSRAASSKPNVVARSIAEAAFMFDRLRPIDILASPPHVVRDFDATLDFVDPGSADAPMQHQ